MSGFLLDTNIPSEFRNPRPEPRVVEWVDSLPEDSVFISVVTLGEIRKGCELLDIGKRRRELEQWLGVEVREWFAGRILPVTDAIAERWGRLEARRERLGLPLNTADGQIAATALEHGLTLVTRNVKHFTDLQVDLFNPLEPEPEPDYLPVMCRADRFARYPGSCDRIASGDPHRSAIEKFLWTRAHFEPLADHAHPSVIIASRPS